MNRWITRYILSWRDGDEVHETPARCDAQGLLEGEVEGFWVTRVPIPSTAERRPNGDGVTLVVPVPDDWRVPRP